MTGQQEQPDADEAGDVGVAEEHAVVAQQQHDRDRADQGDRRPGELTRGGGIPPLLLDRDVDAVDHRDAEAREERGDRHDEGVGIPRPQAQHDVQREHERGEPAAVDQEVAVDRAQRAELHQRDGRRVDDEREDQEAELAVALRLRHADALERAKDRGVGADRARCRRVCGGHHPPPPRRRGSPTIAGRAPATTPGWSARRSCARTPRDRRGGCPCPGTASRARSVRGPAGCPGRSRRCPRRRRRSTGSASTGRRARDPPRAAAARARRRRPSRPTGAARVGGPPR